jgi:hypothetical protein
MITYEIAKALFDYDPKTGMVTWKFGSAQIVKGAEIGSTTNTAKSNTKYRTIKLFGLSYKVHRIIWLMQTGDWPKGDVDHIDGDGLNNKWDNLRDVTHSQNLMNSAVRSDSTSGYKGVSYDKARDRWYAYINIGGKRKMLGRHRTMQEAVTARQNAERELFGDFARSE